MFCPNCGTKNDDTATPCTKCGFKLSGTSAPKFRGTMMLNSEQSVTEMVEEHRRKLAEVGTAQEPAAGPLEPGTAAPAPLPAGGTPAPPKGLLQPPRAGLPKRRMGTMLGVAPQIGGVQPPDVPGSTPPPPPGADSGTAGLSTDPLGGTLGFAAAPAGRTEAFQEVPGPTPQPLAAGRTEAFAAVPKAPPAAPARGRTEVFEATSPAPAAAAVPAAQPHTPSEPPDSYHPAGVPRSRLRPLDLFLVVITCGLYGLVLWARQQRKPG